MDKNPACKSECVQENANDWWLTWINGPTNLVSYIQRGAMIPTNFSF